jgi:hypothetical protein
MERFYKLTRSDGTDLYWGKLNYRRCMETGELAKPLDPQGDIRLCSSTVVHASREPRRCFSGFAEERRGLDKLAMFIVEGEPVVDNGRKQGFLSLRVLEELPADEWKRLVYGDELRARLDAARPIIDCFRSIPWLKPSGPVSIDLLQQLASEHIEALVPWQQSGGAPLSVLPVRVLTAEGDARLAAKMIGNSYVDGAAAYAAKAADGAAAEAVFDEAYIGAAYSDAEGYDKHFFVSALAAKLLRELRWYMLPFSACYRAWRWAVVMDDRHSPFAPLIEMWSLGVLPLGLSDGEYLVYAPGGAE